MDNLIKRIIYYDTGQESYELNRRIKTDADEKLWMKIVFNKDYVKENYKEFKIPGATYYEPRKKGEIFHVPLGSKKENEA